MNNLNLKINAMKKSPILVAVLFLGLSLFSCKFEDVPPSKKELLTNKTWLVSSKMLTPSITMGGMVISDILILESDEVRKYSYKYDMDGTLTQFDHLNQVKFKTKWSFNSDETQITHQEAIVYNYPIVGDLKLITATIESITDNQIVALLPFTNEGTNYVITIIFKPK